jgi:predicted lipoprotein with Yx(FWY)xxD motif
MLGRVIRDDERSARTHIRRIDLVQTISKLTETSALPGDSRGRRRFLSWAAPTGVLFAAATVLAACGSGSGHSATGGGGGNAGAQGAGNTVVSLHDQSGVGKVLVDSAGKTLYFSDEEKAGTSACKDSCLGFWFPLTVTGKTIPAPAGMSGKLGTVKRSDDGQLQATYNGAPLYTFKLDTSAGDTKGDNFSDDFGGTHFSWHAASTAKTAGGAPKPSDKSSTTDNGGYGNY